MSPYEKCLFWWTEVNLFGLEFARRFPRIPVMRLRSERMLAGDRGTNTRLVEFLELPWDERWLQQARSSIDRWHHRTDKPLDPLQVLRHPRTVETAQTLGYEPEDVDLAQLRARYIGAPDPGLDRIGRYL
jgi:hypothetical protein